MNGRRFHWERLVVTAGLALAFAVAGQEAARKEFFLPKSPTAAAYVLGRLSSKELIEAPRGEFVYAALLLRKGLDRKYRLEAIEGLAKIRQTDPLTELLAGIAELDRKGEESEVVLRDLSALLSQFKPGELAAKRDALQKRANDAELPLTRQIAFAAVVVADGSIERAWKEANPGRLADLVLSIDFIRSANLRAGFYAKIQPLLKSPDPVELQRAAMRAVAAVPGHETDAFRSLADLARAESARSGAIAALQRIAKKFWPQEAVAPLLRTLMDYLQQVPQADRTEADYVNAVQFAGELASALPPDTAASIQKTLRGLGPPVFVIRTVYEQMLYDKQWIVVEAGKPVEIILQNEDSMPHNLVVVAPGAVEEIGLATEKMPPDADGQGRLYVPNSPKVLQATRLIDPGQKTKLVFTAPNETGDYPYVCTYPGHWRRMVGTMAVVKDVETYLASRTNAEPKITEWKVEDLAPQLGRVAAANTQNGKQLFTQLACAQCHKLGKEGYAYGPDLTDVLKRFQNNRSEVLRQILEPSLVVTNRYRNYEIALNNGESLLGMIVKEQGDTVLVQTGPSDALIQTLKKSEIKERQPQPSSPMPVGLLNQLSKEQIFDLLAYIESGGNAPPLEHKH